MLLTWLAAWRLLPAAHAGTRCVGMAIVAVLFSAELLQVLAWPRLRWTHPWRFFVLRLAGSFGGAIGGGLSGAPELMDVSRPGALCFHATLAAALVGWTCGLALGERERDLVDDENSPRRAPWRTVPSMRHVSAFMALRIALSLGFLVYWTAAWLALPHLSAGVPGVGAALAWACGAAGLILDVETFLSGRASNVDGAVWRACVGVGVLLLSVLAFPPAAVHLDAPGVRAFVVAAAITALGLVADLVSAVGVGARE